MAGTQFDSVQMPPRLPLVIVTSNRDGTVTKDARLVNCYIEVTKEGELDIYKRPGLVLYDEVLASSAGRGVYFWEGSLYSIFGDNLYKDGIQVGTGLNASGGLYRFDSNLGATPKLILGNGEDAYTFDGTTLSATLNSIDSDYPDTTVKGFAFLNGYTYVMQETAYIHQSALNSVDQPGDWDPINVIRAQIEPDKGVFLSKQLVYVVAFKQWTIEYFFDAGNPTGSSLGPVQGMKVSVGCASGESIQKIEDIFYFLSTSQTAALQISVLDRGAHRVVSTPSIDKLLQAQDLSVVYSWQLKLSGHSFYIITFKNSNLTLAYDITQDLWFQWTDSNGDYFPIVSSAYDNDNNHVLQHESNGNLYRISPTIYEDLGEPIIVDIITPKFDADIYRRKMLNMFKIIGDQVDNSNLQIRYTDDDYQHWSNWRSVDLGVKQPMLINCGTFIKRAYHLRHTSNTPFRIRAIEVQYDVGTL